MQPLKLTRTLFQNSFSKFWYLFGSIALLILCISTFKLTSEQAALGAPPQAEPKRKTSVRLEDDDPKERPLLNLRTELLYQGLGKTFVALDFAAGNTFSFGAFASYHAGYGLGFGLQGYGIGAEVFAYPQNAGTFRNGWFLHSRGGLESVHMTVSNEEANSAGNVTGTSDSRVPFRTAFLSFAAGYGWFWRSGFNMQLGIGGTTNKYLDAEIKTGEVFFPLALFSLGWTL